MISVITEIELMGYNGFNKKDLDAVQQFISYCSIKGLDEKIKNEAIRLRRDNALKIPDAIILATSLVFDVPFMTADKDFKAINEGEIIIYEI